MRALGQMANAPKRAIRELIIDDTFLRDVPVVATISPFVPAQRPASGERPADGAENPFEHRPTLVKDPVERAIAKHPAGTGSDRRRRWRAKIAGRVLIRGSVGTIDAFEEVARTIDVSRDGLLLNTSRGGYWVGQPLQVTFPFWTTPTAINTARRATVVRNIPMKGFRCAVAVSFDAPIANGAAAGAGSANGQVKVLSVEADPVMARAVRSLLESDGYAVVMVATADQALDILKGDTPDVLLAEAGGVGQGVSGCDLCRLVKRTHRLQHIPVILLTKSALPSDYSASRRAGATVCVPLPCDPERLQRTVHLVAPPPGHRSPYSAGFNVASFVKNS